MEHACISLLTPRICRRFLNFEKFVDPSLSLQNLVMYISNVPRDVNHVSLIQLYFILHGMTNDVQV
jgi:hypothetical protein